MGDLFGFNYHDFSIVSIKCHTHLGAIVMKSLKLLVQILMAPRKKNDITSLEEKNNDNTSKLGPLAPCDFQTLL